MLCRWIAKRVRQMSRKYYICFGFWSIVTDYFWQLCETRDRQGHKKRGVTKDVPTWFDSPQTFLKRTSVIVNVNLILSAWHLYANYTVVLSFKMIAEWSLYMVSPIDCKPFSSFESVLAGISSVDSYACLQLRWSFGPSRHKDKRKTRGMTTALIMKFCLHFKVRHKIKKKFNVNYW